MHALVGAGQLQPPTTECLLVLVQAVQRVALLRLPAGLGRVHPTEVHLRAPFADRELDRAPAKEVQRAGMRLARRRVIARMDRREPAAVAVQDETRDRVVAVAGRRLEKDEVTRGVGGRPPGDERLARTERELPALARFEEQIVEAVERGRSRGDGRLEPLPCPVGPAADVVPPDLQPVALGAADPLAGRLGDAGKDGLLVRARPSRSETRWRDGWISSIGRKPAAVMTLRNAVTSAGTSGSAATTSEPAAASRSAAATWRAARRAPSTKPAPDGPRGM